MSLRDDILVGAFSFLAGAGLCWATSVPSSPSLSAFEAAVLAVPPHRRNYYPPDATRLKQTGDRLALAAERLGVTISADEPDDGNFGQITYSTRTMKLQSALKGDARLLVEAHELAHLLQPVALEEHGDREMFAESVAYLVVGHEANYTVELAEYAARHKTSLPVLSLYREEIQFAAAFLWGGGA